MTPKEPYHSGPSAIARQADGLAFRRSASFSQGSSPSVSGRHLNGQGARGIGVASGHHGEILQGVFLGRDGRRHRGLVTLPFAELQSVAWLSIGPPEGLKVEPQDKTKAKAAVALLLERLGDVAPEGVRLRIRSNIPKGYGLGSSTADVLAALRSLTAALGVNLSLHSQFGIAVEAESASDGTMFVRPACLVAHREGRVLEVFDGPLPPMGLISVNLDPERPVNTLKQPRARYSDDEIEELAHLRHQVRRAISERDLRRLGEVATCSAVINQRHLQQPHFDEVLAIARRQRAIGLQVAHSGRMLGVLLPPGLGSVEPSVAAIMAELRELGLFPSFHSIVDQGQAPSETRAIPAAQEIMVSQD